ncbi:MAG: adenosine kinase [Bacteroidales bacterium]|nr:adenosine kinase [Deltaproteobacteria bacterium]MBL7137718.1 adenosine kinase [Bacteroidales bacterium]
MKKILGIGNALVDILIRIDQESLLEQLNLPKGSMQLVNKLRSDEILMALKDVPHSLAAGGSAANTIHGLGMLGAQTGYIGVVGRDEFGKSFEQDMRDAGVEPYLIRSDTETGRAITLITPDSERTFATYLGAAVELSAFHLSDSLLSHEPKAMSHEAKESRIADRGSDIFSQFDYLHIEGYLVQNHNLIRKAIELAKANGLLVSLDLASYNVVEANLAFLEEIVAKQVHIIFANEEEAQAFTGYEPARALHHLAQFCEVAIVKTGSKGSMVKSRDVVSEIGIIPVRPVDTTGAGDLYAAGFLYGHSLGWPLSKCGQAGALLAGNIIEEVGAKMPAGRWEMVRKKVTG